MARIVNVKSTPLELAMRPTGIERSHGELRDALWDATDGDYSYYFPIRRGWSGLWPMTFEGSWDQTNAWEML